MTDEALFSGVSNWSPLPRRSLGRVLREVGWHSLSRPTAGHRTWLRDGSPCRWRRSDARAGGDDEARGIHAVFEGNEARAGFAFRCRGSGALLALRWLAAICLSLVMWQRTPYGMGVLSPYGEKHEKQGALCLTFREDPTRLKSVEASVDVNGSNKVSGEWYHILHHTMSGLPACALRLTGWCETGGGAHANEPGSLDSTRPSHHRLRQRVQPHSTPVGFVAGRSAVLPQYRP